MALLWIKAMINPSFVPVVRVSKQFCIRVVELVGAQKRLAMLVPPAMSVLFARTEHTPLTIVRLSPSSVAFKNVEAARAGARNDSSGAGRSFFWNDLVQSIGTGRNVAHIMDCEEQDGHSFFAFEPESEETKRDYKR